MGRCFIGVRAVFISALALMLLLSDFFDPVRSRFKSEINMDAFSMLEANPYRKSFVNIMNCLFLPISRYYKEPQCVSLWRVSWQKQLLHYYALECC